MTNPPYVFPTHNGKIINLLEPTADMIDPDDIAWALAHILRYGGHSSAPINVASHSINAHNLASSRLNESGIVADKSSLLPCLLHDAAEAYLGDVIRPLKILLGDTYGVLEAKFELAIAERFSLPIEDLTSHFVKSIDMSVYAWERRDVGPPAWDADFMVPTHKMPNRSSEDAYREFRGLLGWHGVLS